MSEVATKASFREGLSPTLMNVAKALPMKSGVKRSMNAVGRSIVQVIFPSAFSFKYSSTLCLLAK